MCDYGWDAFDYCTALEDFTVSVEFVQDLIFLQNCTALTHLTILGEGNPYYVWKEINFPAPWLPMNIESITLPQNLGVMEPNASADHACWTVHSNWSEEEELQLFSFPQDVSSYLLPSTVTSIRTLFSTYDKRYDSAWLLDYKLFVPSSVTHIPLETIGGVPLYLQGSNPPTIDGSGLCGSEPIYVKSEHYSTYQSAWSTYISDYGLDLRTY